MPDPLAALGVAALIVAVSLLLFWPERGLFGRWQRARRITRRVLTEDALKHIHKFEMSGRRPSLSSIAGALQVTIDNAAEVLGDMQTLGLLAVQDGEFSLTPDGRQSALHIIRAHRLWERYLADRTGFSEAEWHEQAERYEHLLQPADVDALSAWLGNPTHDPHGDPIPDASGEYISHGGQPLPALALDKPARIVHIEDEPEIVYAQLVAEGLHPGMQVRLTEVSPRRVRFWANGEEHLLAPIVAVNISAAPIPQDAPVRPEAGAPLSSLQIGQRGQVIHISPRCRGEERRRLMDLGVLPGAVVKAEMTSPSGDPTAYRIRGAMIALRQEQASMIHITPLAESAP